jgi:hypothetical protein
MFLRSLNEFRELAIYFNRNGEYPYEAEFNEIFDDLNRNSKVNTPIIFPTYDDFSPSMQEFAKYWIKLFRNGANLGDIHLTGEHLFYLNCAWITRNNKDDRGKASRGGGFPDFWDEDYKYLWTCQIASEGIDSDKWNDVKKHCDFNLIETPDNLNGGKDVLYGKPRGVGASWKGGNYANYNMFLVPESKTFILADKKEYLEKDGLYSKFDTLRSHIVKHCWWLKKGFIKESLSDMHYKTGNKFKIGGNYSENGFLSEVIGVTIDGDPDKARGKRGNILFEEFGSFPLIDEVWLKTEASVNEYGTVYGQRRGFGTGGDTGSGLAALEKMFFNPKDYRLIEFKNIYEEVGDVTSFFTPAYRNITHKDAFGNSDEEKGKAWLEKEETKKREGNDPTDLTRFKAEFCSKPSDMFKNAGVNILPVELIDEQLKFLEKTNYDRKCCTYGTLENSNANIIFSPKNILPYEEFPAKSVHDKTGCIAIYKKPYVLNGLIPKNLYIIAVDGYTQNESTGDSVGSATVYEQPNKYTDYKGDMEVAWYDARPEGFDGLETFAKNIFYLAELYNAQVMIENDQVGELVTYAKKHKDSKGKRLTIYLAEQPNLKFEEKIEMKKSMNRTFGINMTESRKAFGLKYLQQWLLTPRGVNLDGKVILNLHHVMNRGALAEMKKYHGQNADRLSSRIVGMYHLRENEHKIITASRGSSINRMISDIRMY